MSTEDYTTLYEGNAKIAMDTWFIPLYTSKQFAVSSEGLGGDCRVVVPKKEEMSARAFVEGLKKGSVSHPNLERRCVEGIEKIADLLDTRLPPAPLIRRPQAVRRTYMTPLDDRWYKALLKQHGPHPDNAGALASFQVNCDDCCNYRPCDAADLLREYEKAKGS